MRGRPHAARQPKNPPTTPKKIAPLQSPRIAVR